LAGQLRFRWPFTGLAGAEKTPGWLAVIAVLLGSVAFDGLSRTSWWQNLLADVESPYGLDNPNVGELLVALVSLAGLTGMILLVGLAYRGACSLMRSTVGRSEERRVGKECRSWWAADHKKKRK